LQEVFLPAKLKNGEEFNLFKQIMDYVLLIE